MAELDLGKLYPEGEDIQLAFNRSMSIIREEMTNLEWLMKKMLEGSTYISEEEVAKMFRCKVSEIPSLLVRYRPSKQIYLYKVKDVIDFIEARKLKG